MFVSVIIAAAGLSRRMGCNKQFIEINGVPVLSKTIEIFQTCSYIQQIIVVIHENDIQRCNTYIIAPHSFDKVTAVTAGGQQRQDSVYNGIAHLSSACDAVLVHDGARCFVTHDIIENIVASLHHHQAAIPVVPCKDTIKKCKDNMVIETPPRHELFAVQTPQGFKRETFLSIYEHAQKKGYYGTDDASLAEYMNIPVFTVAGSYENIKLTTPDDVNSIMKKEHKK